MDNNGTQRFRRNCQLELFASKPIADTVPNPDRMRAYFHGILAKARATESTPWPPDKTRLYRLMFPQLSFWLPEEEAARVRSEFKTELERLAAA